MKSSALLAVAFVIILLFVQHSMGLRLATFLPFLLIPVHAFEVLKQDAMSGWNKFETVLPVKRRTIVTSKYITFLLFVMVAAAIVFIPFLGVHLFAYPVINELFFNFSLRGMALIISVATVTFPLTYILGTEKSDTITMSSIAFAFGLFFGVSTLLQPILGTVTRFDEIFSITFLGIATILFMISYGISLIVYLRKEF